MEAVAAGATGYLQKYSGKDRLLEHGPRTLLTGRVPLTEQRCDKRSVR